MKRTKKTNDMEWNVIDDATKQKSIKKLLAVIDFDRIHENNNKQTFVYRRNTTNDGMIFEFVSNDFMLSYLSKINRIYTLIANLEL